MSYDGSGLFIVLEGGEGAGKSTQTSILGAWLKAAGFDVVLTREPGDTALGTILRSILLGHETGALDSRAEVLLYAADKAEHVSTVIRPALARGAVVISDRYVDSTLAYQGAGRDLGLEEVASVARWATGDLRPQLTILLDVDPAVGLTRFSGQDRLEAEPLDFHRRVRQSFLALAAVDPDRYLVVDAGLAPGEIAETIRARLTADLAALRLARDAS